MVSCGQHTKRESILKASGGKKTNILDIFAPVLKLSGSKNSFKVCSLVFSGMVLEAKRGKQCWHPLSQLLPFPRPFYIPGDPEHESETGPESV